MNAFDLTPEEQANVRAAIRFVRGRVGGWTQLAKLIGMGTTQIRQPIVSPKVLFRVARLAGVPVDDLLTGRFPAPNSCPHCGQPREGADPLAR